MVTLVGWDRKVFVVYLVTYSYSALWQNFKMPSEDQ